MNNELGAVGVLQIMKGLIVILGGSNFIPGNVCFKKIIWGMYEASVEKDSGDHSW